ncbi:MAG: SMP-30/gluconolactonase/LRE family protein [Dongiaceae bacterium]
MSEITRVLASRSHLGESPLWDEREQVLWWIDIYRPTLNRFDPATGRNLAITLDQSIHAFALRRQGGVVASLQRGFGFVDPVSGLVEILADPLGDRPVRFNDGKSDRQGRFWSGSMAKDWVTPLGALYRLDADRRVTAADSGFRLSNGLGWSPDDARMYFTDFGRGTIFVYDFDAAAGTIANRRPLVVLPDAEGRPDGLAVDAEGHLWVALWDGWAVARYDPHGRRVARIALPVQRPTSCAFGGPDLATLYVTSAAMDLDAAALAAQPDAGSLFAISTGARGLVEPRFAG